MGLGKDVGNEREQKGSAFETVLGLFRVYNAAG